MFLRLEFSVSRVSQKLLVVYVHLNQEIFRESQNCDMFCNPKPPWLVGLKMRSFGYRCLEELINFVKIVSRSVMCFLLIVGMIATM